MTAEFSPIFRGLPEPSHIGVSIPIHGETELGDAAKAEWEVIAAHVSEEVRSLAEDLRRALRTHWRAELWLWLFRG